MIIPPDRPEDVNSKCCGIFKKGIGGIDALVKSFSVSKIYAMVRESPETFRYFCFFTFSET